MSSFSLVLPHSVRITVTINTFVRSRSSLENHTRIQTQMGKVYICFQTKKAPKTIPFRAAHTYMAYIGEYPPPLPPHTGERFWLRDKLVANQRPTQALCCIWKYLLFFLWFMLWIYLQQFQFRGLPEEGLKLPSFLFCWSAHFFHFFFSLINWGFIATFSRWQAAFILHGQAKALLWLSGKNWALLLYWEQSRTTLHWN